METEDRDCNKNNIKNDLSSLARPKTFWLRPPPKHLRMAPLKLSATSPITNSFLVIGFAGEAEAQHGGLEDGLLPTGSTAGGLGLRSMVKPDGPTAPGGEVNDRFYRILCGTTNPSMSMAPRWH